MTTPRIHAGICHRILTIVATRDGYSPELPYPAPMLIDPNDVEETLVDHVIVNDTPRASEDQKHRVYRTQAKYVYALARPLNPDEKLRAAASPALVRMPDQGQSFLATDNLINGTQIYSSGRIEHHAVPGLYGFPSTRLSRPTQPPPGTTPPNYVPPNPPF